MPFDPRFLDFPRWSALTASALQSVGFTPVMGDEEHWQKWADAANAVPLIAAQNVPRPSGFKDWRMWALRLNEALWNLGL